MDHGDRVTEQRYRAIRARVDGIYRQAWREIDEKAKQFAKRHAKQEALLRQQVADGKISQADFDAWMRGQVFQGKQWQAQKEQMQRALLNADRAAQDIINGARFDVFAANANYVGYHMEQTTGLHTSFHLYDANAVSRLARDNPDLLPPKKKVGKDKAYKWYNREINNAVTQGIVQGEGVREIARRVGKTTGEQNASAMLRNARTMLTGAQNAGRIEGMHQAQALGIKVQKQWLATLDDRTRDTHAELDGQIVDVDEPFVTSEGNEIMYPGDPDADPSEVWNCRCTLVYVYPDYPSEDSARRDNETGEVIGNMTYREWEEWKRHQDEEPINIPERTTVVNGRDITGTWERRPDQFDFEIEDLINAQGFDGVPKIVGAEDFDRLVRVANGGEGFIAQRTYSAPDRETLDAYRQQLYGGQWYVDCSSGGSAYGKGMYCVSDYSGKLTDRVTREIDDYMRLGEQRIGSGQDYYAEQAYQQEMHKVSLPFDEKYRDAITDELGVTESLTQRNSAERKFIREWIDENPDLARQLKQEFNAAQESGVQKGETILNMSSEEFIERYPTKVTGSYVETFTVDESAKIISYSEAMKAYRDEGRRYSDVGAFAAAKGYDAIRVESAGYTVILNRTKLIFRRPS